ncbi:DUF2169 domain-containing protein [Sorangium sp. So ce1000]|uniref:DUF2169 family type VI secretion system accessory protein n=1 Tax=Sorangium sp. So ce1000 TaxID=3133325 RepID=UPI003F600E8B
MLTIACHAIFELAPIESPMTSGPAAPLEDAGDERRFVEPWGPVAPFKRWGEVLVVGHAHAPEGSAVTSLIARLAVGDIDKAIEVRGDACFARDGSLGEPAPFTRMPLRWERAAGGPHTANPIGVPTDSGARADRWGRARAPNLLPAASSTAIRHGHLWPAGFGPLRPEWPDRAQRLRRHAAGWDHARWAEQALPEGIDTGYFNAAPLDQVTNELTGTEPIVLEHLHPRFPRLATRLRAPAPSAIVMTNGAELRVPLRCDTLVIDADHGAAALVWRGQLMLDRPPREGVVLVREGELAPSLTGTMAAPLSSRPSAVLPFLQAATQLPPELPAGAAPDAVEPRFPPAPALPRPVEEADTAQTRAPAVVIQRPALPFHAFPPEDSRGRSLASRERELEAAPPAAMPPAPPAAMPPAPPASMPPAPPAAMPPATLASMPPATPAAMPPAPPAAMPPATLAAMPPVPRASMPPAPPPLMPWVTAASPSSPPARLAVTSSPAPPAWLAARGAAEPAPTATPAPDIAAAEQRPAAVPEPRAAEEPAEPILPVDAYPLARCAAIAARLAKHPEALDAILAAEALSPETWEALHAHWLDAIRADVARGQRRLLSSYDAAYVAALEAERGPITAGEYAVLVIASERGNDAQALAKLGLPDGVLLRLRRVWLERIVKDPAAAQEVRAAMRRAAETS